MKAINSEVLERARETADTAVHTAFGKNPGNVAYGSGAHDYWRTVFEATVAAHIMADRIERGIY
jgi:hypothetical protein